MIGADLQMHPRMTGRSGNTHEPGRVGWSSRTIAATHTPLASRNIGSKLLEAQLFASHANPVRAVK